MKVEFNISMDVRPTGLALSNGFVTEVTYQPPVFDHVVEQLVLEIAGMGRYTKYILGASGKCTDVSISAMLTSHNILQLERHFREAVAQSNPELKVHFKYGAEFVMVYTEDTNREQKFSGTFDFGSVMCWLSQILNWPTGAKLSPNTSAIAKRIAARADEVYLKAVSSLHTLGQGSVELTDENMAEAFNSLYREKGMPEFKVRESKNGIYFAYYCDGDKQTPVSIKVLREIDYLILAAEIHRLRQGKENVD